VITGVEPKAPVTVGPDAEGDVAFEPDEHATAPTPSRARASGAAASRTTRRCSVAERTRSLTTGRKSGRRVRQWAGGLDRNDAA
jgi:hypothetical protein